ncbi:hypothetical protein SARC_03470 [Sphaeroforma arctica JP610]|uniref:Uncharacterized protein n=1 Tax=Sphaeroforma arctica JP610 TaxID=667725 RepID=A0A0L0G5S9_9EUKA|nr:hypothetical protein SARC_03470 [Sphaeroforma arctica JP610]KNC84309.1 hypothetical protein SARC_03470 [Sphaeroforma arctica JP610]|eukprot:XP_014158211.1 hypothetical protein SARC_03470 [Sphaeroforma arctica JP610]
MWREDELIVVPQSAIKWSWLKGTNVPLSPQVKLLLDFRQPKPRTRGKKAMKKRHKPRRSSENVAGGASEYIRGRTDDIRRTADTPWQPSVASSASDVSSGDDKCPNIM